MGFGILPLDCVSEVLSYLDPEVEIDGGIALCSRELW